MLASLKKPGVITLIAILLVVGALWALPTCMREMFGTVYHDRPEDRASLRKIAKPCAALIAALDVHQELHEELPNSESHLRPSV